MQEEQKFYGFQRILKFLGIDYEFNCDNKKYPFNRGKENVYFSWGQIIIPKSGIEEMVQNKISDINEKPISEIKMIYNIPFYETSKDKIECGALNKNIRLTFRYDKEYKYGEVTKSIYEVCYWIVKNARKTNDFYIISDSSVLDFMSYYVIPNQWGLGTLMVCSPCTEKMH